MDSCPDSWDATHSFGETKKLNFGVVIKKTLDFSLFQGKVRILDVFLKKHCLFLAKFLKIIYNNSIVAPNHLRRGLCIGSNKS